MAQSGKPRAPLASNGRRLHMTSAILIDRIYTYVCVQCDRPGCMEIVLPEVTNIGNATATDPVDAWAIRAATEAENLGWSTNENHEVICPVHTSEALVKRQAVQP